MQPMQRRMSSFVTVAMSLFSLSASTIAWCIVLADGGVSGARLVILIAGALGIICAVLGLFVMTRGSDAALLIAWLACGIFAGLGIPTLLSIGMLFIVAAIFALVALMQTRSLSGEPWWHPRFMGPGYLAFAATLVAFIVL